MWKRLTHTLVANKLQSNLTVYLPLRFMSSSSSSLLPLVKAPQMPSLNSNSRPSNVGIHAIDMYFPKTYVSQCDLESHNGVSAGKYTAGLGQDKMAFCTDREDIYSICMTAVSNFMSTYRIPYTWIGRLEIGSETILDHSKAIKTYLMPLFEASGNSDVEGIDTMNACYGGTNAFFNSVAWVESSAWDGRYALQVSADIAEYAEGPARPTGGCGVVVTLIGPDAPLVVDGVRASHMEHAYDFYKPNLTSPYPIVDGKFSNSCYLKALDQCYATYNEKLAKVGLNKLKLADVNYILFHAPYNKLVQKSAARLVYNEFLSDPSNPSFASLQSFSSITPEQSYTDVPLEKACIALSKPIYNQKVVPSITIPQQLGNMYTASLYAGIMSVVMNEGEQLAGRRMLLFSYGSGLAASLFTIRARTEPICVESIKLVQKLSNISARLSARSASTPAVFSQWMAKRESLHLIEGAWKPEATTDDMFPGTFYLEERDALGRRTYSQTPQ